MMHKRKGEIDTRGKTPNEIFDAMMNAYAECDDDLARVYAQKFKNKVRSDLVKMRPGLIEKAKRCEICGYDNPSELCIHHIIPVSHWGDNKEDNLLVVCKDCHKTIHKFYLAFNTMHYAFEKCYDDLFFNFSPKRLRTLLCKTEKYISRLNWYGLIDITARQPNGKRKFRIG